MKNMDGCSMVHQKPIAFDAYETLAESYAAMIDTKAHNADYERQATLSLLPESEANKCWMRVAGQAYIRNGWLTTVLEVVALDVSPKWWSWRESGLA
jgi:hypothetical protein